MIVVDGERGPFILYNPSSGVITAAGYGVITSDCLARGDAYLRTFCEEETHYVDVLAKEVRPKNKFTLPMYIEGVADGVSETVLKVPTGAETEGVVCEDGTLELTFDTPGEHQITITHPHYMDATFTVYVKEPPE